MVNRSSFGNIESLKNRYPGVDVERTVEALCQRLNAPGAEQAQNPDALLTSWVKKRAEQDSQPRRAEPERASLDAYGRFRLDLVVSILAEGLTPKAVSTRLLAAKLGPFGDHIGSWEIEQYQRMGETWV